jgi:hypothetical protein
VIDNPASAISRCSWPSYVHTHRQTHTGTDTRMYFNPAGPLTQNGALACGGLAR